VFGVGTSLVMGSGAPTAGLTYKLVAIDDGSGQLHAVAKKSADKVGIGGRKVARRVEQHGVLTEELVIGPELRGAATLQVPFVLAGNSQPPVDVASCRSHHQQVLADLRRFGALDLAPGSTLVEPTLSIDVDSTTTQAAGSIAFHS
jgi:nicotinate phosphoribosyltransferase